MVNPFDFGAVWLCSTEGVVARGSAAVSAAFPPAEGAAKPDKKIGAGAVTDSKAGRLRSLGDLPRNWWVRVPNEVTGYQMVTQVTLFDKPVTTLLDYGAAVNAVTEEIIVGMINEAAARGVKPTDRNYPLVQLEQTAEPESVAGIAKGRAVQISGNVVLRVSGSAAAGRQS